MMSKKKIMYGIYGVLFGVFILIGTYAWLTWKSKETALVLTIGNINNIQITLKPYVIDDELLPVLSYESGVSTNVDVVNNSSVKKKFKLYYKINDIAEELVDEAFKYTITRSTDNGNTYEIYKEGNFVGTTSNSNLEILEETIVKNDNYKYKVYLWLDGDGNSQGNVQGKVFSGELRAEFLEDPKDIMIDLPDGMIPVIIANDGIVTTISKDDTNWYDYDNKKWANAVLVNENSRSNYLNTMGKIISEDDILAYYVYIPRYKYKIWETGKSATGKEQEIEIEFENKYTKKSTGTQVGEYLTHPAFTFGDTELNGIWVGKFETTGTADNPTIKPNVASLVSQTISAQFATAQLLGGTTYGINSSKVDSHMMKNSEWGAAAYLSHSKYGINDEIRINNYYNSEYLTGCGANTANASSSTDCEIVYGSTSEYPQSTTGNISGIYDMSGGAWEYVMGYYSGASTTWGATSDSNYALFSSKPDSKYYDDYTSTNLLTTCSNGICYGHALSETAYWHDDYAYFVNTSSPWFRRGGNGNFNGSNAGVFNFVGDKGSASSNVSFRSVIASN